MKTLRIIFPLTLLCFFFLTAKANALSLNNKRTQTKEVSDVPLYLRSTEWKDAHRHVLSKAKFNLKKSGAASEDLDIPVYVGASSPFEWEIDFVSTDNSYTFDSSSFYYNQGTWDVSAIAPGTYTISFISDGNPEANYDLDLSCNDSNDVSQDYDIQNWEWNDNPFVFTNVEVGNFSDNALQFNIGQDAN